VKRVDLDAYKDETADNTLLPMLYQIPSREKACSWDKKKGVLAANTKSGTTLGLRLFTDFEKQLLLDTELWTKKKFGWTRGQFLQRVDARLRLTKGMLTNWRNLNRSMATEEKEKPGWKTFEEFDAEVEAELIFKTKFTLVDGSSEDREINMVRSLASVMAAATEVRKRPHYQDEKYKNLVKRFDENWPRRWCKRRKLLRLRTSTGFFDNRPSVKAVQENQKQLQEKIENGFAEEGQVICMDESATASNSPAHVFMKQDDARAGERAERLMGTTEKRVFTTAISVNDKGRVLPAFIIITCSCKSPVDLSTSTILDNYMKDTDFEHRFERLLYEREMLLTPPKGTGHDKVLTNVKLPYLRDKLLGDIIIVQNKGWMDTKLMVAWVDLIVQPHAQKLGKRVLVVLDNAPSHVATAVQQRLAELDIASHFLVPNTTPWMCILDVYCNGPFKSYMKAAFGKSFYDCVKQWRKDVSTARLQGNDDPEFGSFAIDQVSLILTVLKVLHSEKFMGNERMQKSIQLGYIALGMKPTATGDYKSFHSFNRREQKLANALDISIDLSDKLIGIDVFPTPASQRLENEDDEVVPVVNNELVVTTTVAAIAATTTVATTTNTAINPKTPRRDNRLAAPSDDSEVDIVYTRRSKRKKAQPGLKKAPVKSSRKKKVVSSSSEISGSVSESLSNPATMSDTASSASDSGNVIPVPTQQKTETNWKAKDLVEGSFPCAPHKGKDNLKIAYYAGVVTDIVEAGSLYSILFDDGQWVENFQAKNMRVPICHLFQPVLNTKVFALWDDNGSDAEAPDPDDKWYPAIVLDVQPHLKSWKAKVRFDDGSGMITRYLPVVSHIREFQTVAQQYGTKRSNTDELRPKQTKYTRKVVAGAAEDNIVHVDASGARILRDTARLT
jgi:hypothetical protein